MKIGIPDIYIPGLTESMDAMSVGIMPLGAHQGGETRFRGGGLWSTGYLYISCWDLCGPVGKLTEVGLKQIIGYATGSKVASFIVGQILGFGSASLRDICEDFGIVVPTYTHYLCKFAEQTIC